MPGTAARARRATCCAADDGSGHRKVTAAAGAAYVARVAFLTTHATATSGSVPDAAAATVPPSTIDLRSGGGLAVWQTLRLLEAIDCDARIFEADVARSMSHATSDVQEVGG